MADGEKITVRIDKGLREELGKHCAATGKQLSEAVRDLLSEALLSRNADVYAAPLRRLVRSELDRWLELERVQREFAADDYYDRLSAATASEMDELRRVAGATLFLAATLAESGAAAECCADGGGGPLTRDDWYAEAMEVGRDVGVGATISEAVAMRDSEAPVFGE